MNDTDRKVEKHDIQIGRLETDVAGLRGELTSVNSRINNAVLELELLKQRVMIYACAGSMIGGFVMALIIEAVRWWVTKR